MNREESENSQEMSWPKWIMLAPAACYGPTADRIWLLHPNPAMVPPVATKSVARPNSHSHRMTRYTRMKVHRLYWIVYNWSTGLSSRSWTRIDRWVSTFILHNPEGLTPQRGSVLIGHRYMPFISKREIGGQQINMTIDWLLFAYRRGFISTLCQNYTIFRTSRVHCNISFNTDPYSHLLISLWTSLRK